MITFDDLDLMRVEGFNATTRTIGPLPPGKYTFTATDAAGRTAKKIVTIGGAEDMAIELKF